MKNLFYLLFVLFVIIPVHGEVDHNPLNNGNTLARTTTGHHIEGALHNPALLGADRAPRGGMTVPGTMLGVGLWSDKLALSPFNKYWADSMKESSLFVSKLLKKSFDLEGLNAEEVSERLSKEFRGGLTIYAGVRSSLLNFGWNRFAFDLTTHFDEEVHIPEAPLLMNFSENHGLVPGSKLDFSSFKQDAIWATDLTMSFGLPVIIPALQDLLNMQYGAGGIGVKYVMGHSVLTATTARGTLEFKDDENEISVDGEVKVRTAGMGFSGPWSSNNMFDKGLPVSGHGFGMDLGGILYNEHSTLSVNFNDIGVLFWTNGIKEVTYKIHKDDLDAYDIIKGIEDADNNGTDANVEIFGKPAEEISGKEDTLKNGDGFSTPLPAALNIGYSYQWDFSKLENQDMRLLAEYAFAGVNYEQALARTPGRRYIPRFSLGGEAGALRGFLPVRLGYVFGGAEKIASAVGAGLNFSYVSLNASYKAVGSPFFIPKRGSELAVSINVNWGMSSDQDNDGILDKVDQCKMIPEDIDGFEDEDGCPDYDNDKDSIADTVDSCINYPEDHDGFEDTDGCPDFDNDNDGVLDSIDQCPMDPEDKDNFRDDDGCPDTDNDGDNIPDSVDKCPLNAEDIDGYEDVDGCPDYDNDVDGIADTVDNCINEPETYNGFNDVDGCPDTLIKPTEEETKKLNTRLRAINFKTGSAELVSGSYAALDYIADFLKSHEVLRYEIQGHTDSRGEDEMNLLLSAARASTVRQYILSKGIPAERVIGIGYGETMPIAENKVAAGRALNRRVEFRIVETNDEYNALKIREADFLERVRAAKIKGYK